MPFRVRITFAFMVVVAIVNLIQGSWLSAGVCGLLAFGLRRRSDVARRLTVFLSLLYGVILGVLVVLSLVGVGVAAFFGAAGSWAELLARVLGFVGFAYATWALTRDRTREWFAGEAIVDLSAGRDEPARVA